MGDRHDPDTPWAHQTIRVLRGLVLGGRIPFFIFMYRRLSLDLCGLPPRIEQLDRFLADNSLRAYEGAVERLLNSPHFGEQLAQDWLDFARYGDTNGYHVDSHRDMWLFYGRGWDHHGAVTTGIRDKISQTDQATAALLTDLKSRGLLDDTPVIWGGEFGRTSYS